MALVPGKSTRKFGGEIYTFSRTLCGVVNVNMAEMAAKRNGETIQKVKAKSGKKTVYRLYVKNK